MEVKKWVSILFWVLFLSINYITLQNMINCICFCEFEKLCSISRRKSFSEASNINWNIEICFLSEQEKLLSASFGQRTIIILIFFYNNCKGHLLLLHLIQNPKTTGFQLMSWRRSTRKFFLKSLSFNYEHFPWKID